MPGLKICTAIRDKELEDTIFKLIEKSGHSPAPVTQDDIVNAKRSGEQLFIVEDSYRSILDMIESHNCEERSFIPVIFLTDPKSEFRDWVKDVKYPQKYFPIEKKILPIMLKRVVTILDDLRLSSLKEYAGEFQSMVKEVFADPKQTFTQALQKALVWMLEFVFAEKGSVMLLNEKGNLVIEAATKKEIQGLEIPYNPSSVAWTVVDTKEPLFVEDISKDNRFQKKIAAYSKDYFLSVPIFIKGEIRGVLNLSDKSVALLFTKSDLYWINFFLSMLEPVIAQYYLSKKYRKLKTDYDNLVNTRDSSVFMLIHDLKLPLSSIKGNLEIIRMSGDDEEENQYVDTAIASCEDMHLMVNSILDLYRMKSGNFALNLQDVNVSFLVGDIVESFSSYARLSNISLFADMEEGDITFHTDPSMLSRVLGNLVLNALKHSNGGNSGKVWISLSNDFDALRISVNNSGETISTEAISEIFKPFYTQGKDRSSHGLGLTFVKQAVELLKGAVTVSSENNVTTFMMTFPK